MPPLDPPDSVYGSQLVYIRPEEDFRPYLSSNYLPCLYPQYKRYILNSHPYLFLRECDEKLSSAFQPFIFPYFSYF